ncbi:hypothetical protein AB0B66_10675 [Catellatospora sp. NPDC049111]|uniref:hypothetical protein n=1 Tax=Catellatospora sp. NPDC049111 TaxID=3155271 RepID=UPI0033EE6CE6
MNHAEMGQVLAKCALFDNRAVTDNEVVAWHEAVGHLNFDDAMQAVTRYYAHSKDRMWPVDLTESVTALRSRRAAAIARPPAAEGV